nr:hypothetical protein [Ornithinimicrobium sp. F0845]
MLSARDWADTGLGQRVGTTLGLASIAALAILADLDTWGDLLLLAIAGATTGTWVVLTRRAVETDRGEGLALGALSLGVALTLLLSGWSSEAGGALSRWLDWTGLGPLTTADPTRFLLLAGLVLIQLSTGNIVVRLVLAHTGALNPLGEPQPSDRLRGGRLLGPMERVFILGLGLAGQVTAASIVIAAKGLIRWPELQRASRDSERWEAAHSDTTGRETTGSDTAGRETTGSAQDPATQRAARIDQVTEYFLIGSFVSWLIALAALAVSRLA